MNYYRNNPEPYKDSDKKKHWYHEKRCQIAPDAPLCAGVLCLFCQ